MLTVIRSNVSRYGFRLAQVGTAFARTPDCWHLWSSDRSYGRSAMQIKRHDRSHLVELRDGSAWRIWPGDIPKTSPTLTMKSVRTR
jgi:hypothetical protein